MKKEVMFAYGNMLLNNIWCILMTYTYDNDTIVVYVGGRKSQLFVVEATGAIIFGKT